MSENRTGASVGFDVGATTMRVARVNDIGLDEPRKIATPDDASEGVRLLSRLIRECAGEEMLAGIAGGVPAVVSAGRIYRAPNKEGWTNFDLRGALSSEFGVPVMIENDADLAGLGEAIYGAGAGSHIVAYIGIGTGVGTARIVNGRIDKGVFDFEAGHQIVDASAGATLEELVAGEGFAKRFGVHPRDVERREYERMTPILAAGIFNTILHWSPEVVILGGSMMNEESGYRLSDLIAALKKLPPIYPSLPQIKLALHGDDAGLYGARALLCGR